ncbi:MAG: hypothetical protein A2021_03740 [Elusimicrobia bacterium GWF2_52_66]|nr:MAG: hypothetical protein A2021_03740 [Elusimicrobia bacterium GWF2_52_66]
MTLSEAEALLKIRPPYSKKQVEDAYTSKMRGLNNAYVLAAGPEQDRLDREKVKAGEAKDILLNVSAAPPSPNPSTSNRHTKRRQSPPIYTHGPNPGYAGGGINTNVGPFDFIFGELCRFLGIISQFLNTTPQVAAIILGMSFMMGMIGLFGGRKSGTGGSSAYVLVLSDPVAQVYINGKYCASAPFINPLRIDVGGTVEFRFINPEYPALEQRIPIERERKYVLKVHLDEGTCESAEVADWEKR